jgi:hypothetical protein
MSLGNRTAFPNLENRRRDATRGMSYREWLIGMIAAGTVPVSISEQSERSTRIIEMADQIIKRLDEEEA